MDDLYNVNKAEVEMYALSNEDFGNDDGDELLKMIFTVQYLVTLFPGNK